MDFRRNRIYELNDTLTNVLGAIRTSSKLTATWTWAHSKLDSLAWTVLNSLWVIFLTRRVPTDLIETKSFADLIREARAPVPLDCIFSLKSEDWTWLVPCHKRSPSGETRQQIWCCGEDTISSASSVRRPACAAAASHVSQRSKHHSKLSESTSVSCLVSETFYFWVI